MQNCLEYPDRPCYGLNRAKDLEDRFNAVNEKNTITHREIFERLRELEISQAETKTQYGNIMESLGAIKSDVSGLKSKPGKRWEALVAAIISAVVSAAASSFVTQIIMMGGKI